MADPALDEISVQWEEDGVLKVRQLDKRVLSTGGGWATIAFLFEEREPGGDAFRGPKVALRRYKKRGDRWVVDTRFVLTGPDQAGALAGALQEWLSPKDEGRDGA